jgi:acyl-CoA hydrolase
MMNKREAARQSDNSSRRTTAEEALGQMRSGMRVFIGSGCATPQKLVAALAARGPEVFDVEIIHILTIADAPYAKRELLEHFRHNRHFIPLWHAQTLQSRASSKPVFIICAAIWRSRKTVGASTVMRNKR